MIKKLLKFIITIVKTILKIFIYGAIAVFSFTLFYVFFISDDNDVDSKTTTEETKTTSHFENDIVIHNQKWKDFNGNFYETEVQLSAHDFENSLNYRTTLDMEWGRNRPFYEFCIENADLYTEYKNAIYWIYIYKMLQNNDQSYLQTVYESFEKIKQENILSSIEFAEIIITQVQHIPYTLIHEDDCKTFIKVRQDKGENTYEDYHPDNCLATTRFGLQSPYEFCYNLKGDCDTRSLLLYDILSHFDYDVAVLYSREYAHAILGVNLPATGSYLTHNLKKYYIVETTAKNWQIGQISPTFKNLSYWKILFTSK